MGISSGTTTLSPTATLNCADAAQTSAVADFTPAETAAGKLKKDVLGDEWSLRMVRNPDILGEVVPRHRASGVKVVGFALETEDVIARAMGKLRAKGLDFIVANNPRV